MKTPEEWADKIYDLERWEHEKKLRLIEEIQKDALKAGYDACEEAMEVTEG